MSMQWLSIWACIKHSHWFSKIESPGLYCGRHEMRTNKSNKRQSAHSRGAETGPIKLNIWVRTIFVKIKIENSQVFARERLKRAGDCVLLISGQGQSRTFHDRTVVTDPHQHFLNNLCFNISIDSASPSWNFSWENIVTPHSPPDT